MLHKIKYWMDKIPLKVYIAVTVIICVATTPIFVVDGYQLYQNHVTETKLRKIVSERAADYNAYEKDLPDSKPDNDLVPMDTNKKTVYIVVKNPILKKEAIKAVYAWNNTGATKFTCKTANSVSDIKNRYERVVISEYHMNSVSAKRTKTLAYTRQQCDMQTGLSTGSVIKLNTTKIMWMYMNHKNFINYNIEYIVEHELGHTLGLQHRQDKHSVMYPYDGKYSIKSLDVKDVRLLYRN